MTPEITASIFSAIIAAAVTLLVTFLKTRYDGRVVENNESKQISEEYRNLIDILKKRVDEQDIVINTLREKLALSSAERKLKEEEYEERIRELKNMHLVEVARSNELKARLLITQTNPGFPFPSWRKDQNLVMQEMSRAYEIVFLEPMGKSRKDYIGKTDHEFWPKAIADEYHKNDMDVIKGALPYYRGEEPIRVGKNNIGEEWVVVKYRYNTGQGIGCAGFAVPTGLVTLKKEK